MRKLILLAIILQIVSCSKDKSEFILEKSFGSGYAYDTEIASDTTFLIAGASDNSPLLIKTTRGSGVDINYSPEITGIYTEVLEHEEGYLLSGSSEGNILLALIDKEGTEVWDTIISVSPEIRITSIFPYTEDTYLLIGSDHPDSLNSNSFITAFFDVNGSVLELNESSPGYMVSVTDCLVLPTGEIYVSITKNSGGDKSKASVARITGEGAIIWETELYNNNSYAAGSLTIAEDGGSVFVAGQTELIGTDGPVRNSFVASLTQNGMVSWKKYLENSNIGTDIDFDSNMNLLMLNHNCLILNAITLPDGSNSEKIRTLDACDSYDTKILGRSLSVTYENNYFIAGSKDDKFYYILRSGDI